VGVSYNEAVANKWLIPDALGHPISEVAWGYPMLYLADIGNPAYVDAFARRALATCQAYGNTGIYLDSLNIVQPRTATGRYWPGGSGAAASRASWTAALVAAVAHIYSVLQPAGKSLWLNVGGWDPDDPNGSNSYANELALAKSLYPYGAGVQSESWLMYGSGVIGWDNQNAIAGAFALLQQAEAAGLAFNGNYRFGAYGLTQALDRRNIRYLKGVFDAATTGRLPSGVSEGLGTWDLSYTYDIGAPAGPMFGVGVGSSPDGSIGYGRPMSGGLALVNTDAAQPMTYQLSTTMVDQDGSTHGPGALTLQPHDAVFLKG
jgi:hypothetical protein